MTAVLCSACEQNRRGALVAFESAVGHALADRVLTPEEEAQLRQYQADLGLADAEVARLVPNLWRGKTLFAILSGSLPPVDRCPVLLKRGEEACWVEMANLLEERTRQVRIAGSSGWSFRIVKGVSYRVGSSAGQRVPITEIATVGPGTLVVTNKRVLFVGPRQVSVPLAKLISVTPYVDGIELHYEGQKRREILGVTDGEVTAAVVTVTAEREAAS